MKNSAMMQKKFIFILSVCLIQSAFGTRNQTAYCLLAASGVSFAAPCIAKLYKPHYTLKNNFKITALSIGTACALYGTYLLAAKK